MDETSPLLAKSKISYLRDPVMHSWCELFFMSFIDLF